MGAETTIEVQIEELLQRLDTLEHRVTQKLDENERRLARLETSSTRPAFDARAVPPPPPIGATPLPPPRLPAPAPTTGGPTAGAAWTNPSWEVLLRWAGIVLLALAAIFLVSTSISRGWIGPNLQLAAATLGGLSLLGGSVHFAPRLRAWSVTLGAGGAVVLPVCAAAAHEWLDLVSMDVALILIVVATVLSLAVGYATRLQEISIIALLAVMVVPAGFGFFQVDPITLAAWWIAATALTAAVLGWARRSTLLRIVCVAAAGAGLLFGAGLSVDRGVDVLNQALGPLVFVTVIMWLGPALADRIGGNRLASFDHWTVAVAPGFAWLAIVALGSRGEESDWFDAGLLGLMMAGGFLAVLIASFRFLPRSVSLAHFLGAGALVTASIVAMADGPVLVVALAAQAAFTFILGRYFNDGIIEVAATFLGVAAAALTGVGILDGFANEGATLGEGLAHFVVLMLLTALAVFYRSVNRQELAGAVAIAAWIGVLGWFGSVLINLPQGQAAISMAWATMAAGAIGLGVARRAALVRTTGLVTLTVVVGKLLTIDLGEVDVFWRVGLFFIVGSGLLRLAYVLPRYDPDGTTEQ